MGIIIGILIGLAVFFLHAYLQYKCPICKDKLTTAETPSLGYCFKCSSYFTR